MIYQHTCPICGTHLDAEAEIARLRARIASLETVNASSPTTRTPGKVTTLSAARKTRAAQPDYRTAAECWLAGDPVNRPKPAAYRRGAAKPVDVDFADGVTIRASTYLEGQEGLNEAGRFARASRMARSQQHVYPVHLLYEHIAEQLQCQIVENDDGYFYWIGSQEDESNLSRSVQAVVMEMCIAHGLDYADTIRDAQMACPAWIEATRQPGQWVRDTRGAWRLVDIQPCPDIVRVAYAAARAAHDTRDADLDATHDDFAEAAE